MAKKSQRNAGKIPVGTQLPADLLEAAKAFADERGESFSYVVELALRRHLAYPPPPPEIPPLPDAKPAKQAKT